MKFNTRTDTKQVKRYGMTFPSTVEADFYQTLKVVGIPFEYQHKIVMIAPTPRDPSTQLLRDSGIKEKFMKVDFKIEHEGITYILDTKGHKKYVQELSTWKYTQLKRMYFDQGESEHCVIKFVYATDVKRLLQIAVYLKDREKIMDEIVKLKTF